jgi:hypothetical protein
MNYNKKLYLKLVRYNAKLAGYEEEIHQSDKPAKKFYIITPENKKVYFGARGMNDFLIYLLTEGEEEALKRRRLYRKRHNKDPRTKYSAGELAREILW